MTIYSGPNKEAGGGKYSAKFVRVEDTLITTEPFVMTQHRDLAKEEGVLTQLESVGRERPDEIDGGIYDVEGSTIRVAHYSAGLDIPVTLRARERTVELFREKSEGYEVTMNPDVPYETLASISKFGPRK